MSIDELVDSGPADSINVEVVDGSTVVHLVGEIDTALRQQASDSMGLALMHGLPVVIDATDLRFIDSSGIAFVLQLHMAAAEAGIPMSLRDHRGLLRGLLAVVGLGAVIPDEVDIRS